VEPASSLDVLAREVHDRDVDHGRGSPLVGTHHGVASPQRSVVDPGEVQRDARPRVDRVHALARGLDAAHANRVRTGAQLVVQRQRPAGEGPGHDRPRSLHGEDPVDPQSGPAEVACRGGGGQDRVEDRPDLVQASPRHRIADHHRRRRQGRPSEAFLHLELRQLQHLGVDEVGLRQRHHRVPHAEQLEDAQMLLALGHPPFGRGDDEEGHLDRADAGEHVLDEADVAGNVDEPDLAPRGERRERESEVDGEAPRLLLRQPVGIGSRERVDEGGLPVVDMTRGRDRPHRASRAAARAAPRR